MNSINEFDKYLIQWELIPDGEPLILPNSRLLPVRYKTQPAMLKIAMTTEEKKGSDLMRWWHERGGLAQGFAPILAHDDAALLMERAVGEKSLIAMAKQYHDDEASRIICDVVAKLHAIKNNSIPLTLRPLTSWFSSLQLAAMQHGDILNLAMKVANELLQEPQDIVVLHGDIHHGNILDFGVRGWLAIDPKGLLGERSFDFANIFCNPDYEVATRPGRLERQVAVVAKVANLNPIRLIKWIIAYAGLSAAWHFEDGTNPELAIAIAKIAAELISI